MWTCVHRFYRQSERVRDGQKGKDFAVVSDSEGCGFEATELESRLYAQADLIRKRLSESPGELSPEALEKILRALINCRAGITSTRCRLLAFAGDYGDSLTVTAEAARGLMEDLRTALAKLGPEGERILAVTPKDILKASLPKYVYLGGGDEAGYEETIETQLKG